MRYILTTIVMLAIIAGNLIIILTYKHERRPRKSDCEKNFKQIIKSIANLHNPELAWKLDRDSDDFPEKLLELARESDAMKNEIGKLKKSFICPFRRDVEGEKFSYQGIIEPKIKNLSKWRTEWPVLWDRTHNHEDGVHVAYFREDATTTTVKFLTHEEFKQLRMEMNLALKAATEVKKKQ